jgi:hypothetical protein
MRHREARADMRLNHTLIAASVAITAVTGVAIASVGGSEPADDPDRPTGSVSIQAEPVQEGQGAARIVVTREPGAPARLRWATEPGTASAGEDFESATGVLQFHPGEHRRIIEVGVRDDGRAEGAETFDVRLDVLPGITGPVKTEVTTVTITS